MSDLLSQKGLKVVLEPLCDVFAQIR